jgi:1-acyl-sn-glycerol-3-phosphate acyltransferase
VKQRFALLVLKVMRWTPVGPAPEAKKYVMLSAPHTTNWDLPALLMATWSHGTSVNFLGKHQLFRGPMNWLMRSLGGIPVRREGRHGMVESLTAEFAAADEIALAIPAAGTRSYSLEVGFLSDCPGCRCADRLRLCRLQDKDPWLRANDDADRRP